MRNVSRMGITCDKGYNYKLVEEPEEIQSGYDWKKERYDILKRNPAAEPFWKELDDLEKWLKDNPKECWVQCDDSNTEIGDTVRSLDTHTFKLKITYISRNGDRIMAIANNNTEGLYTLDKYEINIHKQGER